MNATRGKFTRVNLELSKAEARQLIADVRSTEDPKPRYVKMANMLEEVLLTMTPKRLTL